MRHLVFLLEGPSEKEALKAWVPRLLPESVRPHFIIFEGKQDMERRMVLRIRHWLLPDTRFLVLRDQDSGDCRQVKDALLERCHAAGRPDTVVRIACHELESFFLGDWDAVAKAFLQPRLAELNRRALYRDPDRIANPGEELRRHIPQYQKRDGARRIAPLMALEQNRSRSFGALRDAIRSLGQP